MVYQRATHANGRNYPDVSDSMKVASLETLHLPPSGYLSYFSLRLFIRGAPRRAYLGMQMDNQLHTSSHLFISLAIQIMSRVKSRTAATFSWAGDLRPW